MPDSEWQEMTDGEREPWDISYADGMSNGRTGPPVEQRLPDGTRTRTTVETWTYPTLEPAGGSVTMKHKCVRCGGRHDHYLIEQNMLLRPDVVYDPLHVAEGQWGVARVEVHDAVRVTGQLVRRIRIETIPPAGAPRVSVKWEQKTLDHIEQREFVQPPAGWDEVIDCATGIRVASYSYFDAERDEILVAVPVQQQAMARPV